MKEKLLSLLDSRRAVYFIIIMTIIVQTGFLFYCNWRWHNITVDEILQLAVAQYYGRRNCLSNALCPAS